jgi:galactose mutarotase-like enzyme
MIALRNRHLKVVIDEDHGGEVVVLGPPEGRNVLFHEPWSTPLPAEASTTYGSGALDWLSRYRGGWQVMFPSTGAESTVDGVPHPLHGEVSLAHVDVLHRTPTSVSLRAGTRLPLQLVRTFTLDPERPVLRLEERVHNEGNRAVAYAWGQHPAFVATPGMVTDLPAGPVHVDATFAQPEADLAPGNTATWPSVLGREGQTIDLATIPAGPVERVCYLPDRPAGWAALRDKQTGHGIGMAWDIEAFPHLWLWEQIGGWRFPFFGRARIVALEPVSCWPGDGLAAAVARGQARFLAAGGEASAWVTMSLVVSPRAVCGVDRDGSVQFA